MTKVADFLDQLKTINTDDSSQRIELIKQFADVFYVTKKEAKEVKRVQNLSELLLTELVEWNFGEDEIIKILSIFAQEEDYLNNIGLVEVNADFEKLIKLLNEKYAEREIINLEIHTKLKLKVERIITHEFIAKADDTDLLKAYITPLTASLEQSLQDLQTKELRYKLCKDPVPQFLIDIKIAKHSLENKLKLYESLVDKCKSMKKKGYSNNMIYTSLVMDDLRVQEKALGKLHTKHKGLAKKFNAIYTFITGNFDSKKIQETDRLKKYYTDYNALKSKQIDYEEDTYYPALQKLQQTFDRCESGSKHLDNVHIIDCCNAANEATKKVEVFYDSQNKIVASAIEECESLSTILKKIDEQIKRLGIDSDEAFAKTYVLQALKNDLKAAFHANDNNATVAQVVTAWKEKANLKAKKDKTNYDIISSFRHIFHGKQSKTQAFIDALSENHAPIRKRK